MNILTKEGYLNAASEVARSIVTLQPLPHPSSLNSNLFAELLPTIIKTTEGSLRKLLREDGYEEAAMDLRSYLKKIGWSKYVLNWVSTRDQVDSDYEESLTYEENIYDNEKGTGKEKVKGREGHWKGKGKRR